MKYKIKVFIPIEDDDPVVYESLPEVLSVQTELVFMQPENRYEIEEVEEDEPIS